MVPRHEPTLRLQAAPARGEDAGRNVVRLPRTSLEMLGVEGGDPVAIESRAGLLWARALPAHPDDEGIDAARLDGTEVECPELIDGGVVRIHVAPVRPAREVEVATDAKADGTAEERIREALAGVGSVLRGDRIHVDIEGESSGFDMDVGVAGLSLLRVVGRSGDLEGARVRVVSTVPEGPVRVGDATEVRILT